MSKKRDVLKKSQENFTEDTLYSFREEMGLLGAHRGMNSHTTQSAKKPTPIEESRQRDRDPQGWGLL